MSEVPEMVERVARVIADESMGVTAAVWEKHFVPEERRAYYRIAEAAIKALREPIGAMIKSGVRAYGERSEGVFAFSEDDAAAVYPAMISAALGESNGD